MNKEELSLRTTNAIRRDIQINAFWAVIMLGIMVFFAIAFFTQASPEKMAAVAIFLAATAYFISKVVRYAFEHRDVTTLGLPRFARNS
jgi:hypothetical protein